MSTVISDHFLHKDWRYCDILATHSWLQCYFWFMRRGPVWINAWLFHLVCLEGNTQQSWEQWLSGAKKKTKKHQPTSGRINGSNSTRDVCIVRCWLNWRSCLQHVSEHTRFRSGCFYTDSALRRCHHLRTKQRLTQRNVEATLLRSQICMPGYCKIHNLGHIQPQEFDCILKFQSRNAAPAYWVENNVWMLQGGEIKVGEQENFLKDASFSHQVWVSPRLSRAVNQTKRSAILKEGILHMCSM